VAATRTPRTDRKRFQVVDDTLVIGDLTITFQRTLRVSEQGINALPPGLGNFPLRTIDPMRPHLPEWITRRGGVLLPLYLREAMWLSFSADQPVAIQIGIGGRCVVSGEELVNALVRDPQNYVVTPTQPWIDGYKTDDGEVRQFVAVAPGSGQSAEHQLTGSDSVGGVQIQVWHLTPAALKRWRAQQNRSARRHSGVVFSAPLQSNPFDSIVYSQALASPPDALVLYHKQASPMAVGLGGAIEQEIYPDEFAAEDWQAEPTARVWVHLVSIPSWCELTGEPAPSTPVSTETYIEYGLPWFDYYDADAGDIPATDTLANLKSIGELTEDPADTDGAWVHPDAPVVRRILDDRPRAVSPGDWDWA